MAVVRGARAAAFFASELCLIGKFSRVIEKLKKRLGEAGFIDKIWFCFEDVITATSNSTEFSATTVVPSTTYRSFFTCFNSP
jgi:hypothetical protein